MLMAECPLQCFSSSKWGGKVWAKLKSGEMASPGWLRLQQADFWQEKEKYGALHRILNGTADTVNAELQTVMSAERSRVSQAQLQINEYFTNKPRMTKQFLIGPVMGVFAVSHPKAIIMECEPWDDIPPVVTMLLQADMNVPLVIIGPPATVFKVYAWLQLNEVRKTQKSRTIWIHMDDPGWFGPKEEHSHNATLQALLYTNVARIPTTRDYIATRHLGFFAEMYDYLLSLLGMGTTQHTRNILFVPSRSRSMRSIQTTMAEVNARLSDYAFVLGTINTIADVPALLSGIQSDMSKHIVKSTETDADRLQRDHVHRLIRAGDTIGKENLQREQTVQEKEKRMMDELELRDKLKKQRREEMREEKATVQQLSQPAPSSPASVSSSQPSPAKPEKKKQTVVKEATPKKSPSSAKKQKERVQKEDTVETAVPVSAPATPEAAASSPRPSGTLGARKRHKWNKPTSPAAVATVVRPGVDDVPLGAAPEVTFDDDAFPDM